MNKYLQIAESRHEYDFLYVGPPGDRLYKQDTCRVCKIVIFGKQAVHKDLCGERHCDIEAKRKNPCKFKRLRNGLVA